MLRTGICSLFLVLAVTRVYSGPLQNAGNAQRSSDAQQSSNDDSDDGQDGISYGSAFANPLVSSGSQDDGSLPFVRPNSSAISLEKPDNIAAYLQQLRRPGLRITLDSVNEGYKKKNKNSYKDANISIRDRNSTAFTRDGQVQKFEGPGFNMQTAVLSENTDGKTKTVVATPTDKEKNVTRNRDRLTQFVGTLNTDEFSSGALLTDHSSRDLSKSVKQSVDGNRETNVRKQDRNSLTRGSFLKAANLSINARYQSDSFSNRQHRVSEFILGGASGSDSAQNGGAAQAGGAQGQDEDAQDD